MSETTALDASDQKDGPPIGRVLDEFELHLFEEIAFISTTVSELVANELRLMHLFLTRSGWDISRQMIGPSETYFYRKDGQFFICEHEAIDYELYGA